MPADGLADGPADRAGMFPPTARPPVSGPAGRDSSAPSRAKPSAAGTPRAQAPQAVPDAGSPAVRGADLARQMLARAKQDARARGTTRPGGGAGDGSGGRGGAAGRRRRDDSGDPPARQRLPGIAAPGREWRTPMNFGSAVARLVAERGWQTRATDASVLARWDVLVGPNIAAHCSPVSLRDGELELVAESTAWATQLRMLSRQILGILRKELGPHVVRRITVRGPAAPSWNHGGMYASGGRGPRDTYG
ncbi:MULTISPECIES: DUF721 domain-containing protein [unclassified Parafrankia]|uniref:DUF721 domain-containing protein n=1 Tax=unclassified Parafrankia TaxID=2994368 RepID=UPI000DA4E94E|nr:MULTISPECIES: DciA family protein [unclassified Parafrankia]SQD98645.1 conserved hypothetical protein [Parafrankia sp. Ea1.12]